MVCRMKKQKNNVKNVIRIKKICILSAISVAVAAALFYFILPPRRMTGSQELKIFPSFSAASFFARDYQNDLEQAAKDQFVLHDQAIAWNVDINAEIKSLAKKTASLLQGSGFREELVPFGKVYKMYGTDWLTNLPYSYDSETEEKYRRKSAEINSFARSHPGVKVYVYYCSRGEDLDWFDEVEGLESYPWYSLLESTLEDGIRFDRMKFKSFEEYQSRMYKTDHHWNHTGAAVGYADILRMMAQDFETEGARSILQTEDYGDLKWIGSRYRESGREVTGEAMDLFAVDRYLLAPHRTWFGQDEKEIGLKTAYDKGAVNREVGFDQYLNYYGFESEVITLKYETGDRNLLLVGDSFARALREPLASHFNRTVFVNFRILGQVELSDIMEENDIDTVVFIGQQDAWSGNYENTGEADQ